MASFAKALFGMSKPKKPGPMVSPPVIDDGRETLRRRMLAARNRALMGGSKPRSGTMLTGGSGISAPAPTARKSLVGD